MAEDKFISDGLDILPVGTPIVDLSTVPDEEEEEEGDDADDE